MKSNKHSDWCTSSSERLSYYTYCTGQNGIYTLITMSLTTYLLFSGINPVWAGIVMFAVKIWDALNDAIFGLVFDKVKFKSGKKHMPWLKISSILIPIATIMLFAIPQGFNEAGKLAWFAIAYILWDTVYTLSDVPFYGLINTMSDRMDERTGMMSIRSLWGGAGALIAYIVGAVVVSEEVGGSYVIAAVVMAVIGLATMLPVCFKGQERFNAPSEQDFTIKQMLKYLASNKYLLIYYVGIIFYSGFAVNTGLNLYASFYLFGDDMFGLLITLLSVLPTVVLAVIVPSMIKKADKMKVFWISVASMFVISVINYIVGVVWETNKWVYLALSVLRAIPFGVAGVVMYMFTPDCAEYGKYKTGVDAKGITFAIQTFAAKLTAAISASLGLIMLGAFGFKTPDNSVQNFEELANWAANAANTQSAVAMDGLWFTYVMLPAIGMGIACFVWYFYKLKDKDVQIMIDCNSGKITREEAEQKLSRKY